MSIDLAKLLGPIDYSIAVLAGRCGDGTHVGILYCHEGKVVICHQLWNYRFGNEFFDDVESTYFMKGYAYSIPLLEPEQSNDVINWCRLVARRYLGGQLIGRSKGRKSAFPFALKYSPDISIAGAGATNAGEILLPEDGRGLTCSLFTLLIFKKASVPLVAIETWEERTDDDARHRELLASLKKDEFATADDIRRIEAQLPCVRVRPEEVVAACMQSARPATFAKTAAIGTWILESLDSCPLDGTQNRSRHIGLIPGRS